MSDICAKRVMLAAAKSGSGKTTITCAMLEALKKRRLDPVSFKCGPDYIDPLFHKTVLGVDSRNLDIYFAGADGIRRIMSGCKDAYAVVEGVMGLYDGMSVAGIAGSCYEIAAVTYTPIILIVDSASVGRTIISQIKGILADDTFGLIKGIILNRISEGFYRDLGPVLEKELSEINDDIRLLGFFPRDDDITIKSRHLGLTLPDETEDIREKIGKAASALEEYVDIPAVISIMENAPGADDAPKAKGSVAADATGLTLAVAYDDAFCFYYKDNLEMFEERGVKIRFFSPLGDEKLPENANGILLGGGYPENHLQKLSQNSSMISSIREAVENGIPSLAECGGFMYLHKSVTDQHQNRYELAGVCDGDCFYTGHLVRFGYMHIQSAQRDHASDELITGLAQMKGHEFHYYDSTCDQNAAVAAKPGKDVTWDCMVAGNNGIWGFPHFYYRSKPEFIDRFVTRMKEVYDG